MDHKELIAMVWGIRGSLNAREYKLIRRLHGRDTLTKKEYERLDQICWTYGVFAIGKPQGLRKLLEEQAKNDLLKKQAEA